jgi:hypothetical protein
MTRLQITIDRGPDAKAEECGRCSWNLSGPRITWPDCAMFERALRYSQGSVGGSTLRCPECVDAERVNAENPGGEP